MSRHIIPPLSVVRLARCDRQTPLWKRQVGREFRVGYYSRNCGTDYVWLVNDAGEYEQTVDQNRLHDYFEIVELSRERSFFGRNRPPLGPKTARRAKAHALTKVNGFRRLKSRAAAPAG